MDEYQQFCDPPLALWNVVQQHLWHVCLPLLLPVCSLRAKKVLELLKKEVELCRLQADIREQVSSGSTHSLLCTTSLHGASRVNAELQITGGLSPSISCIQKVALWYVVVQHAGWAVEHQLPISSFPCPALPPPPRCVLPC